MPFILQYTFQNGMHKDATGTPADYEITDKFYDIVSGRSVHDRTSKTGRHHKTEELAVLQPRKWFWGAVNELFMLGIAHNTETRVLSSYFMQSLLDCGVSFAKKCLRKSLLGVMASTKLLVPINLNNAQYVLT